MNVVADSLRNFKEVSTRKQKPRKLEAEFNIWGDLLFLSSIIAAMKICHIRVGTPGGRNHRILQPPA
jgi:hypothetical protein